MFTKLICLAIVFGLVSLVPTQNSALSTLAKQNNSIGSVMQQSLYDDEFNNPVLNPSWQWLNEDSTKWSLTDSPGNMRLIATTGDMVSYCGFTAKNVLLKVAPEGNFEIYTKVDINPSTDFQQAGLLAFNDDHNYVKVAAVHNGSEYGGQAIEVILVENGQLVRDQRPWMNVNLDQPAYIKLTKVGNEYSGFYSQDGSNWTLVGTINTEIVTGSQIGIVALTSCFGAPDISADFDFFHVSQTELLITNIEINQGLGKPPQDFQIYVAGKDTAIRVFLTSPVFVNPQNQQVLIKRYGILVTTLKPQSQSQSTDTLTFLCDRTTCENWQAGNYTIEATVNGVSSQASVVFQPHDTLRILAVPIIVKDRGVIKHLRDDQWMTSWRFINTIYPIASDTVEWFMAPEYDASWLDLTSQTNQAWLAIFISLLAPHPCGLPLLPDCYDKVIGYIPPMPIRTANDTWNFGWTNPLASVVMANGEFTYTDGNEVKTVEIDFMEASTAHEIGHGYGLGDEYNICNAHFKCNPNPPPQNYLYSPREGDLCNIHCTDPSVEAWLGPGTGSRVISNLDHPFEIYGDGALPDMSSFMGSGGHQSNYWITPDIYNHLFMKFTPTSLLDTAPASVGRLIYASGFLGQYDSITIEPWYSYTETLPTQITGTYTIEAVDALSNTLASQGFDVSFYLLSDPPEVVDPTIFQVTAPFPQETTAFRILHSTTVLKVLPVSPNPPEVAVVYPNGSESWGSNESQTVSWTGSDADGDTLSYTVLYSPDLTKWITLGTMITTTQLSIETGQIAGGDSARIRVIVTDGVNTSMDESDGVFSVGKKVPQAFFLWPTDGMTLPYGTSSFLHGYVYDLEDGALGDGSFQWYSDKDGYLGEGKLILVDLSFGNHLITLTAMDSDGNMAMDTIHIYVGNRVFLPLSMKR